MGVDREMGYPLLMKLVLPSGLLGLTFVSLLAAFMSTVDTHINWAASYLVNDIYKRFIRPQASPRHLVRVSRLSVVGIAALSVLIAGQIDSIEQAWKFFVAIGAGMGLPQMLRWLWWRANAWTEISGMLSAFMTAVILYLALPEARAAYLIAGVVLASTTVSLLATIATAPVDRAILDRFAIRVRPLGYWPHAPAQCAADRHAFLTRCGLWVLGTAGMFSTMFGLGELLLGSRPRGALATIAGCIALLILVRLLRRDRASGDDTGRSAPPARVDAHE